jgi:hypothetical protein
MTSGLSRIDHSFGRDPADAAKCDKLSFARAVVMPDADTAAFETAYPALGCYDCYPSLSFLPGPYGIGHFFAGLVQDHRQSLACSRFRIGFSFRGRAKSLNIRSRITLTRGSKPCVNSFFLLLFLPLSRPAWPVTANVRLLALRSAQASLRLLMAMCLPVQSSAVPLAPFVTTSPTFADKLVGAALAALSSERPSGVSPWVAVLHSKSAPCAGRLPCSKRF